MQKNNTFGIKGAIWQETPEKQNKLTGNSSILPMCERKENFWFSTYYLRQALCINMAFQITFFTSIGSWKKMVKTGNFELYESLYIDRKALFAKNSYNLAQICLQIERYAL